MVAGVLPTSRMFATANGNERSCAHATFGVPQLRGLLQGPRDRRSVVSIAYGGTALSASPIQRSSGCRELGSDVQEGEVPLSLQPIQGRREHRIFPGGS